MRIVSICIPLLTSWSISALIWNGRFSEDSTSTPACLKSIPAGSKIDFKKLFLDAWAEKENGGSCCSRDARLNCHSCSCFSNNCWVFSIPFVSVSIPTGESKRTDILSAANLPWMKFLSILALRVICFSLFSLEFILNIKSLMLAFAEYLSFWSVDPSISRCIPIERGEEEKCIFSKFNWLTGPEIWAWMRSGLNTPFIFKSISRASVLQDNAPFSICLFNVAFSSIFS